MIFGFKEWVCRVGVILLLKLLHMEFSTGKNYSFLLCTIFVSILYKLTHFLQLGILYVFATEEIPMGSTYDFHKCKVFMQSMKFYKADKHLWSARNQRELLP